jgi:hypothetical protein
MPDVGGLCTTTWKGAGETGYPYGGAGYGEVGGPYTGDVGAGRYPPAAGDTCCWGGGLARPGRYGAGDWLAGRVYGLCGA